MHPAFTSRVRRALAVAAATAGIAFLSAAHAPFHLRLLRSAPEANAAIAAAPGSIRLWFSQAPELAVTTVKVTGPGGVAVALAPLTRGDSSLVVAPVKGMMAAGAYSVTWRTMAKDGHVIRGTFDFTIAAAGVLQ
jgi:hypothetical protein